MLCMFIDTHSYIILNYAALIWGPPTKPKISELRTTSPGTNPAKSPYLAPPHKPHPRPLRPLQMRTNIEILLLPQQTSHPLPRCLLTLPLPPQNFDLPHPQQLAHNPHELHLAEFPRRACPRPDHPCCEHRVGRHLEALRAVCIDGDKALWVEGLGGGTPAWRQVCAVLV